MSESLKSKTAKGVTWGFADSVLGTGVTALVNIMLARMLTPEDFGLVAMVTIFMTLSTSLVDSGFTGALTRKKEAGKEDFNTVFYFNFAVSLALYSILYFTAPLIAGFYSEPILVPIVRVLGLSLVINALGIVQRVILVRRIDFRTQAIVSFISSVAAAAVALLMAWYGYGVWSLVGLQIAKVAVSTLLLWLFSSWHPGFRVSGRSFREMFAFGSRLLATSILSTIWSEMYSIVIGKLYSSALLGQYSRAEKIRNMMTTNISSVMQKVSYPVLSSVQDEAQRQVTVYRKVLRTTVLISFTAVAGVWGCAAPFVVTIFGSQWLPAVEYLRILCFSGLFLPVMVCSANVINADGRSDMTLLLEVLKTVTGVVPILLGFYLGIEALLWGMVGVTALLCFVHLHYVSKVIDYSVGRQLRDILPAFLVALGMAMVVNLLNGLDLQPWALLLIQVTVGGATVIGVYELLYKSEEYKDIKNQIFKLLKGRV